MDYLERIKKDYEKVNDLVIKELKDIFIIYLETLADQDKINDYILKFTTLHHIPKDIKTLIPSPNVKDITKYADLQFYLESGFTIIINKAQIIAIETRSNVTRAIATPTTEPTIYGPKDSLTENYQINLGLIKRRIKSQHLKEEMQKLCSKYEAKLLMPKLLYCTDNAAMIGCAAYPLYKAKIFADYDLNAKSNENISNYIKNNKF